MFPTMNAMRVSRIRERKRYRSRHDLPAPIANSRHPTLAPSRGKQRQQQAEMATTTTLSIRAAYVRVQLKPP